MDDRCAAITRNGTQCKFSHAADRVYCKMHLDKCLDFIKGYHDICDEIWNEKCTTDMTIAELDNVIRLASMCVYARIRYANECEGGKYDPGHKGAILKVQNLIDRCKMRRMVDIKFGNQNPNGKRQYMKHETHEKIIKKYEDMENEMGQQTEKPLTKSQKNKARIKRRKKDEKMKQLEKQV